MTDASAAIPPALVPIVARFDGARTCEQIAREATQELGEAVPVELVVKLAEELVRGLVLEGPAYRGALAKIERDFGRARPVRRKMPCHAGGARSASARRLELRRYSSTSGASTRRTGRRRAKGAGQLVGLVAPHIDPWRGAVGYGHAYGALRHALEAQEVSTFILPGVRAAPMRMPFALCRKGFATPLGTMSPDLDAIDALADAAPFDAYSDQFNHKREHSLEFGVVFLKHLLEERVATIVPVLAGLGEHQSGRTDPAGDAAVEKCPGSALRSLVDAREWERSGRGGGRHGGTSGRGSGMSAPTGPQSWQRSTRPTARR